MSRKEKAAGKRRAIPESSSDTDDEVFQRLQRPSRPTKAVEDIHSSHLTIWREPFDLRKLPQTMTLELLKRAPFLLGAENAKYNKHFFEKVGGLCAEGVPFESLMKDEHGVPLDDLLATYPLNKHGNRHSLRLMTDRDAARDALHMYQRVYGGTHPDNGEFGTAFIRGLVLFYQRQTQVDWADYAADLAKKRVQNPIVNPQKLTPPCLREQIQAMINLFQHYLRTAYAEREDATSQLRRANLPVKPSDFPARQQGSADPTESSPPARKEVRAEATRAILQGSPGGSKAVRQQRSSAPRTSPLCPIVEAVASAPSPNARPDQLQALKEKRRKTEKKLFTVIKHLADAEKELELLGAKKTELSISEDSNWEVMVSLRASKKHCAPLSEESSQLEEDMRAKTAIANTISESIANVQKQIAELQDRIQLLRRTTKELQDEVGVITADIDVVIVDSSSIRPKQLLARLPVACMKLVKVEPAVPCVLCGRFWVDNAFVSLPCGCLLHPFCMFKVVLSKDPRCPFCSHAPGGLWRGQWGFSTDDDDMRSAISACRTGMDEAGWLKPLDAVSARVKVEDALNSLIQEETQKLAVGKRLPEVDSLCFEEPLPKRAHPDSTCEPELDPVSTAEREEIRAIGAEAALKAESLL